MHSFTRWFLVFACLIVLGSIDVARADGPSDNLVANVRPVPPPGIELSANLQSALRDSLQALEREIAELRAKPDAFVARHLPDVQVFASAVRRALDQGELYHADDVQRAHELIATGKQRAADLARGVAPWNEARGLVVRGYVSKIDGSVQPYGLVVPESYHAAGEARHRLDIWFHGRGEKLSEVNFLAERQRNVGEFAPADTLVLHPYGRYCNANKFAGEIDTLEALADVRNHYRVDDDRVIVRGFSMGGAACWQFAVHYADQWCAANPGAGFSETPDFLRVFQKEDVSGAPDYEKRLWHWYDCTDYARNLLQCPTIAYSGELDVQKQAADVMAAALAKEGVTLRHVIGAGTQHSYHPDAKLEVEQALAEIAAKGRDRMPPRVRMATYTLRYNQMAWVTVDALGEHWERATVDAAVKSAHEIEATTSNVTQLTLRYPAGWCPLDVAQEVAITIDGTRIAAPAPLSDRSWTCTLHREGTAAQPGAWAIGPAANDGALRKRHGLQGPIDDAFMDSFLFVRPTGKFASERLATWTKGEMEHALTAWRKQFRGDARIKDDVDVTDEDIATANLILWGDAASNQVMGRIADQLPLRAAEGAIAVRDANLAASDHALLMIAPNPANPLKYVVLNSGFTFREYDYLNNARQVAKLPDWAIVDIRVPADARQPGKVAAAGFFDESWRLPSK